MLKLLYIIYNSFNIIYYMYIFMYRSLHLNNVRNCIILFFLWDANIKKVLLTNVLCLFKYKYLFFMLIYSHFGGQVLAKNCVQLNELLVPNCIWLTDDLIIPVFENNLNLKKIVLNRCSALTSICLQPVITNCKVSQ